MASCRAVLHITVWRSLVTEVGGEDAVPVNLLAVRGNVISRICDHAVRASPARDAVGTSSAHIDAVIAAASVDLVRGRCALEDIGLGRARDRASVRRGRGENDG